MVKTILLYIGIIVAVAFAGEVKLYPFQSDFRISLGTPIFFFFLLWSKKIHPILAGLFVGIFVVVFRSMSDMIGGEPFAWEQFIFPHGAVFFYYFIYGLAFHLLNIRYLHHRVYLIGIFGVLAELLASIAEMTVRLSFAQQLITMSTIALVIGVAIVRSFFVLGFFSIFLLHQSQLAEKEQRERNEKMMMLSSNLYIESVQLKKTLQQAEEVTKNCYQLYRRLKENKERESAQEALKMAGQIHEIKKDNQRIYAGISKLVGHEQSAEYMQMKEICAIIVKANQRYAYFLEKDIHFSVLIDEKGRASYHTYYLLSLLNNLVSNAVESIVNEGQITLSVERTGDKVIFSVEDDGPGIPDKRKEVVFQHGFTTKFTKSGEASTGIGLSYVKQVVESEGGNVYVTDGPNGNGARFIIQLPIKSIEKG